MTGMRTEDYDRAIRNNEEQAAQWRPDAGSERATDGTEWQLNMAGYHANQVADLRDRRAFHLSEEATEAREWFDTRLPQHMADEAFALWQERTGESAQDDGWTR